MVAWCGRYSIQPALLPQLPWPAFLHEQCLFMEINRSRTFTHRDRLPLCVDQRKFYTELGRLLYAIAAVDGRVRATETAMIKRIVSERLVPQEAALDHFGTDRAYITEFEFDIQVDRGEAPEVAFESFILYLTQHKDRFSPKQKDLVLHAAHVVADAFHGVNAKELRMLDELERRIL